jgi:hypothetical protein
MSVVGEATPTLCRNLIETNTLYRHRISGIALEVVWNASLGFALYCEDASTFESLSKRRTLRYTAPSEKASRAPQSQSQPSGLWQHF